jgi:hypothetical protein
MDQPATVRITTPIISIVISSGVCKSPRLTIKVVAPVGGCEERNNNRTAPVKASESAAAPTRASVTASARIGARMAEIMECRSFRTLARLDALEGAFTQVGGVEGRPISL